MAAKSPKLPLTEDERKALRSHKLTIKDVHNIDSNTLATLLHIKLERARKLKALAEYQQIPSVGPRLAQCVLDLGYYSLSELRNKEGAELVNDLEKLYGHWVDPCVEDTLRLVTHYAKHGDTNKQWWDFTGERKEYRNAHGYPESRPTRAWHEKGAD